MPRINFAGMRVWGAGGRLSQSLGCKNVPKKADGLIVKGIPEIEGFRSGIQVRKY
jgi:hypothetical protein